MTIAERMFIKMNDDKLKSSDLAIKLGVSRSVISSWKIRNANPPAEYIVQICEFLKVPLEYLLTGKDEKSPQLDLTENEREILKLVQPLSDFDKIKVLGVIENYLGSCAPAFLNVQPMHITKEQVGKLFKETAKKTL